MIAYDVETVLLMLMSLIYWINWINTDCSF